ncbi:Hypothetical predicted protein [Olea europaea subsp. europaea]|uniref:Uncharacterized protein n=1 Tax=Olea europaea subsp. europaea TaxID=158383 RepID=A0A8S0SPU6_OLEEU|nr:Hypothetical predicted protein [Olea europaea subsp. europaea]
MVENFRRVASSAMTEILANEFIRSNSGTSSLSSENSEDSLHQSPLTINQDGRWQKIIVEGVSLFCILQLVLVMLLRIHGNNGLDACVTSVHLHQLIRKNV